MAIGIGHYRRSIPMAAIAVRIGAGFRRFQGGISS
jgi:hypothetical protein